MYPGIHGKEQPNKPAVIMGGSGQVVTYGELDARSNQLAHLWRSAGLRRGDHVAVMMQNHLRYFEVVWAALRSGLYITPVNRHLAPAEIRYQLTDSGAAALIASHAFAELLAGALAGAPGVDVRLMWETAPPRMPIGPPAKSGD